MTPKQSSVMKDIKEYQAENDDMFQLELTSFLYSIPKSPTTLVPKPSSTAEVSPKIVDVLGDVNIHHFRRIHRLQSILGSVSVVGSSDGTIHMFSVDYISRGLGTVVEKYSRITNVKRNGIEEGAIRTLLNYSSHADDKKTTQTLFRASQVSLTYNSDSEIYHGVSSKCRLLHDVDGFKEEINGSSNGSQSHTLEFGVVQDVDHLDAIGAIGFIPLL
ncbi:unnamed protein product [Lactuca saligna]|uniref:Uncharacterized protein n=1 Tax=Lactuca saligna TaxID=75948 RepID=A0AA35ZW05_LACSI|nr:unnamed protein product [Lactuca saligna]